MELVGGKLPLFGYFLGKRPYCYHVQEYAMSVWPGLRDVKATTNGFYFFQDSGIYRRSNRWGTMVVPRATNCAATVGTENDVAKIKIYIELWTDEGLSTVASGIGRPLYPDTITRACTRLDFTRVCVMLDVCAFTKPSIQAKPPISVYVPKTVPARLPPMQLTQGVEDQREGQELPRAECSIPKMGPTRPPPMHDQEKIPPTQGVDNQREGREHDQERMPPTHMVDNKREG
ncbi:UNVERIFIED_CONTAM: hypothetical protein Sindi_1992700 [Sesamum indicum]